MPPKTIQRVNAGFSKYGVPLPPTPNKIKSPAGKEISDYIRKTLLDGQEEVELKKEDNIFTVDVDQISVSERRKLFDRLTEIIRKDFFFKFVPQALLFSVSRSRAERRSNMLVTDQLGKSGISKNTINAYQAAEQKITLSDEDVKNFLTKEKHMQTLMLHANVGFIMNKERIDALSEEDDDLETNLKKLNKLHDSIKEPPTRSKTANVTTRPPARRGPSADYLGDLIDAYEGANMKGVEQAINKFEEEGQIITTLNSDLHADIIKLSDKYSIRLGDGKYFVASDNIKITFRDPSETPSWATWFMGAVPLAEAPDRATLFFMPPEEREKRFPKELDDNPIICHASLWKLGEQTGVLLHTSWCHIAASYRWKIDKPFEIASIMFRTASHPAHIARNFGYAPQLVVPGDEWF